MVKLTPLLAALVLAWGTPSLLEAQGTRLLRQPTIGDGQVAFTYGADLWIAPLSGGRAARLTSTPAVE